MEKQVKKLLNDYGWARWTALVLVALMMFFAYMFVDVMSPLQSLVQTQRGWSPEAFGYYAGAEYMLNVFGFLIVAGIILDKMGVRFTGLLSASLMVVGACIKLYAVSDWFEGTAMDAWLNSWWVEMPGSAKLAALGFIIFGCGCEMAGITVSKTLAKWFEGHEMALAMGLEMALARVGVFAIFSISPALSTAMGGDPSVVTPVAFCTALLLIGLISYTVFTFMDSRLDHELAAAGKQGDGAPASDEEFKFSDVTGILSSKLFWVIALLCVLYYSAIFPFQRYATNMLQCNLKMTAEAAADIFRWFPIGAAARLSIGGCRSSFVRHPLIYQSYKSNSLEAFNSQGDARFLACRDGTSQLYIRYDPRGIPPLWFCPDRDSGHGESLDTDGQVRRGGRQTPLQDSQLGQLSGRGGAEPV